MSKAAEKKFEYLRKMSSLKKVLSVFALLLIFIIVVEQPGSDKSKKEKQARFLLPKLLIEETARIKLTKPDLGHSEIVIQKEDGNWRVSNGRSFPADMEVVNSFLTLLHDVQEDELVSKNPDRKSIFEVDPETGIRIEIWDDGGRLVGDFYIGGLVMMTKQYVRHAKSDEVMLSSKPFLPYIFLEKNSWKDKTLLAVDESDVKRLALKNRGEETILTRELDGWHVIQPETYRADELAIRTLFDQLKLVKADDFADTVDASQIDFENADYKVSVRLMDDSLKLLLFSGNEESNYFAKSAGKDVIYTVSEDLIHNLFGLAFRSEGAVQ